MEQNPVVIFGAGATKACGGALTSEILPRAIKFRHTRPDFDREGFIDRLEKFLEESFHVPRNRSRRKSAHYPPLPLLLSLLDIAIDRKHNMPGPPGETSGTWDTPGLEHVRSGLDYAIFAVLEHDLRNLRANYYLSVLDLLFPLEEPRVISLNYDLIADNALMTLSEHRPVRRRAAAREYGRFPNYGCNIATEQYRRWPLRYGTLLKLHGSLNWLFCPGCSRLDIGITESGRYMVKMLEQLWREKKRKGLDLFQKYSCQGSTCPECRSPVRPVIITPTHRKDYRNPHIAQVWDQAERLLREANRAVIVGYSLPEDDVDVIYLLKRGLGHLPSKMITVVQHETRKPPRTARQHPVGQRYVSLFGENIDWHPEGFARFVKYASKETIPPGVMVT